MTRRWISVSTIGSSRRLGGSSCARSSILLRLQVDQSKCFVSAQNVLFMYHSPRIFTKSDPKRKASSQFSSISPKKSVKKVRPPLRYVPTSPPTPPEAPPLKFSDVLSPDHIIHRLLNEAPPPSLHKVGRKKELDSRMPGSSCLLFKLISSSNLMQQVIILILPVIHMIHLVCRPLMKARLCWMTQK